MRFKKLITFSLCFLFVFLTAFTDVGSELVNKTKATSVSEYEEYIKDLEEDQRRIEAEIKDLNHDKADKKAQKSALQKRIDNLRNQISACNRQINDLTKKQTDLQNEILQKNQELEQTKYIFRQRLRAIYMSGGISSSNLAILLSSEDLGDLLSKSELTKSVSAYDKSLMQTIVGDMKTIESNKKELAKLADDIESTKSTLNSKKKELDKDMGKVNSQISDIAGSVGSLQHQSDKLEQAIKEYEQAIKDAQDIGSDQVYDGRFIWPCPGYHYISSPYGYRTHPITGRKKFHKGVDISGGGIKGKPIVAAADGIVSLAKYNYGGYGKYVMVNHGEDSSGDRYVTLYAHMTRYIVSPGQHVKRGQTIGYVGTTGASTGYHLHFEVRINGNTTNPLRYF